MNNLMAYIEKPHDPIINLNLGIEYEKLGQTAAAISFYIRAAERTLSRKTQYIALLRAALCFEKQKNRDITVKTLFQRAIEVCPSRPEAYFFLGKFYEYRQKYHECYMFSSIGLKHTDAIPMQLDEIPEYPGKYGLLFEKAVSGWWVGLSEESRSIIYDLHLNYDMDDAHKNAVQNNLNNIGIPERIFTYKNSLSGEFKYKFNGLEKIQNNYSQTYQDMFVLSILNGKTNGTYLEIGSGDPFYTSNTALLETIFNWDGISIDIDQIKVDKFNYERKNKAICADALKIDYTKLLTNENFNSVIDYLQVDCEPPETSFEILKKVLDSKFKFKIITFEHDYYQNKEIKQKSREYLISHGYTLLINDIAFNYNNSFEDWYVLNEYIDNNLFDNLSLNKDVNYVEDIFYDLN